MTMARFVHFIQASRAFAAPSARAIRLAFAVCLMCYGAHATAIADLALDADAAANAPTSQSMVAGAISARLEVNDAGDAVYHIPIAVPPGVGGHAPELALSYSSGNGGGFVLGPGWQLVGLSSVHRCAAVPAVHGRRGAVRFNESDELCLDGMPLVPSRPDAGSLIDDCSLTLHTYMETFSRLTCDDDEHDYRLRRPDGASYFYGGDGARLGANGKTLSWLLRVMRDRNGNEVRIEYEGEANERRVRRIRYADNEVVFQYVSLAGPTAYMAGLALTESHQLTAISAFADAKPTRFYYFAYETDKRFDRELPPRLARIYECDGRGNCLAPTEFKWSQADLTLSPSDAPLSYSGKERDSGFRSGDFNGDGLPDWYHIRAGEDADRVYLNQGDLTYATVSGIPRADIGAQDKKQYAFADFNGDGRTDVYVFLHRADLDALFLAAGDDDLRFTRRAGIASGLATNPNKAGRCVHARCLRFGDFDGDGRADVYHIRHNAVDAIHLYRESGFERVDGVAARPSYGGALAVESVRTGDFDGDGRTDIYFIDAQDDRVFLYRGDEGFQTVSGPKTPTDPRSEQGENEFHRLFFGHFNADQLMDVLYVRKAKPGTMWLSRGDGGWVSMAAPAFGADDRSDQLGNVISRAKLVDLNGDGRTDVYYVNGDRAPSPDAIYLSDISGTLHRYLGPETRAGADGVDLGHIRFGDFDGDGMNDMLQLKAGDNGESQWFINRWRSPRLARIANGMGLWHAITYRASRLVHTPTESTQYPTVRVPPSRLVASIESADGVGGAKRLTYQYGGGLLDLLGRGRLGFAWREQFDESTRIGERVEYRQDFPYTGAVSARDIYQVDAHSDATVTLMTERVRHESRVHDNGARFIYPTRKTRRIYDSDGVSITNVVETYSDRDDYGNPATMARAVTVGEDAWTLAEQRVWDTLSEPWARSDLRRREIIASRVGHDDIRHVTTMNYDDSGRVLEVTVAPEHRLALTMRYAYDDTGNRVVETVSGLTASTQKGGVVWEQAHVVKRREFADGRFAHRVTNALGHITRQEFDARTGRISLIEDADGRRNTSRYDAWGRKVFERNPAGVETRWQYTRRLPADAPSVAVWMMRINVTGRPEETHLYDGYGRVVQTRVVGFDGRFVVTDKQYDSRGLLVMETRPYYFDETPERNFYAYDALGRVTSKAMRAAHGERIRLTMSYGANYVTESDARGGTLTVYYNAFGQPDEIHDAAGGIARREYDAAARLTAVISPNGHRVSTSYNALSRPARVDDALFGTKRYDYDAFGRPVAVRRNDEARRMFYDEIGRMTVRIEPEGLAEWEYDTARNGIGQLARETYRGYTRAYAYDVAGRLTGIADSQRNGAYRVSIHYDANGRVGRVDRSAGFSIERGYNRHGYLESMSGPPIVVFGQERADKHLTLSVAKYQMYARFYRDLLERMPKKATELSAAAQSLEHAAIELGEHVGEASTNDGEWLSAWEYFRVASRHLTKASDHFTDHAVDYAADEPSACATRCANLVLARQQIRLARAYLDEAERYTPAAEWAPQLLNDEVIYWRVLKRDALGRVTQSRAGNGAVSEYDYVVGTDHIARVAHAMGENAFSETRYRYDASGNMIERARSLDGVTAQYVYDAVDRLASASVSDDAGDTREERNYQYDSAGRPIWQNGYGEYTYSEDQPFAVRALGHDKTYRYDDFGRLVDGDGLNVRWNSFDKADVVARDGVWSNFRYDAGRRRIAQCKSDGSCIRYFGKLYERSEQADGSVEHRHYIHAEQNIVLLVRDAVAPTGTLRRAMRYLHYDAHGSVDSVTDGVGRLIERIEYDSSGARTHRGESSMSLFVRRGYTGHEHLDELGLIHMNGRLYETNMGRFLSPDPLSPSWLSTQGADRYGYAFNNPFKFGDPSGFFFKKIFKAVKRVVRSVVRAVTQRPQIILAVAAGYYAGALASKYAVQSSLAELAFSPAALANGSYMAAVGSALQTGAIIGGAVGGAVAGIVAGGNLRDVLTSAVTGGVLGAVGVHYDGAWTAERVVATSAINGLAAEINGEQFGPAALAALGGSALKYTAWTMRQRMIAQSMLNADNMSGISEGFGGDGFKLGGGRYDAGGNGIPSPFGGHQGGAGAIFGIPYQAGSWQDKLVEAFAGPHDYLNSWYWYGADGNIRLGMSAFERSVGRALNVANLVVAAPIVAASVAPDYIHTLRGVR